MNEQATVEARGARSALAFLAEASTVLASSLDHGATLENVVRLAVPAVADWAAVDVLDPAGAVRSFSSEHPEPERDALLRELRERYPSVTDRAAEGAPKVLRTPEPILRGEITDEILVGLARDPQHLDLLRALSPQSFMSVPLVARDRSLGAMTFVSTTPGRHYDEEDLVLAELLARRCAVAVDNAYLYGEAREAERSSDASLALLDTLFSTAPVGLGFFDLELRYARVNDKLAEINGVPAETHLGRTVLQVLPDMDPAVQRDFARVLHSGEPMLDVEVSGRTPAAPDEERSWLASYYPVRASSGETLGLGCVVVEQTERKRAEREHARLLEAERRARADAETAHQRAAFLAEASAILDHSLEYETTLSNLGSIVVPRLADWFAVDFAREDGRIERLTVAHVDPGREEAAWDLARRYPVSLQDERGVGRVIRTGRAELLGEIDDETLRAATHDLEHLALLQELGLRSVIVAPLRARGRTIGAVSLAQAESGRRFDDDDLLLAYDLGSRAALAVDNALLYREARQASQRERRHADQLLGLTEASLQINSAGSTEEVLRVATDRARELIGTHQAVMRLTRPDGSSASAFALSEKYADYRSYGTPPDVEGIVRLVLRSKGPLRMTQSELEAHPTYEGPERRSAGRPPARGWLAAPLLARDGRSLGLISLSDRYEGDFNAEDEAVTVQLAQLAAVALENVRLYEERTHVARTLQASLLPPRLPEVAGLSIATRYRAAGEGNDVGGDFYDVFGVDGGSVVIIGDVCGKGPEAAAVTALTRYTVRAAAMRERGAIPVLFTLNEAMRRQLSAGAFATVALVSVPDDRTTPLRVTCAGHPLPFVLRHDGRVEPVGRAGDLLGVVPDPKLHEVDVPLGVGDTLLLFTDGVTEARVRTWALGEEGLATLLATCTGLSAAEIVERIETTVVDVQGGEPRDDIALIALRVDAPGQPPGLR